MLDIPPHIPFGNLPLLPDHISPRVHQHLPVPDVQVLALPVEPLQLLHDPVIQGPVRAPGIGHVADQLLRLDGVHRRHSAVLVAPEVPPGVPVQLERAGEPVHRLVEIPIDLERIEHTPTPGRFHPVD